MRTTTTRTTSTTRPTVASLSADVARLNALVASLTPASPAKAAKKSTSTKVLTKARASQIKSTKAGKKYAGMTRPEMIAAGLKGYHLPTGALRAVIANA